MKNWRPLPFTLHPKPWKAVLMLLVALGFVGIGVFLVPDRTPIWWFSVGFFSLCALVFLVQLTPGSSYLTVDETGIEICTLFRKTRIRWSELSEFGVYQVRYTKFVGLNYSPEYRQSARGRAFARAVTGFEGGLPDTYGFKAEELADLLAYHHSRYAT